MDGKSFQIFTSSQLLNIDKIMDVVTVQVYRFQLLKMRKIIIKSIDVIMRDVNPLQIAKIFHNSAQNIA
jgi:hypothetical protein